MTNRLPLISPTPHFNPDRDLFLIVAYHRDLYVPQTRLADATFEQVVTDIVDGQYDMPIAVLWLNVGERYAGDVTFAIASAVHTAVVASGNPPGESAALFLDRQGFTYYPAEPVYADDHSDVDMKHDARSAA